MFFHLYFFEFVDQQSRGVPGDTYRTLTLTGHVVIEAPVPNFQFKIRVYQNSYNAPVGLLGGINCAGVSILKVS